MQPGLSSGVYHLSLCVETLFINSQRICWVKTLPVSDWRSSFVHLWSVVWSQQLTICLSLDCVMSSPGCPPSLVYTYWLHPLDTIESVVSWLHPLETVKSVVSQNHLCPEPKCAQPRLDWHLGTSWEFWGVAFRTVIASPTSQNQTFEALGCGWCYPEGILFTTSDW